MNKVKSMAIKTLSLYDSFTKLLRDDYILIERANVWGIPNLTDNGMFSKFCDIAAPVIGARRTLLDGNRLYVLFQAIQYAILHVEEYHLHKALLPAVEVGVYRGGSSYFIASTFKESLGQEVPMFSIDTFTGHPDMMTKNDKYHTAGRFGDTTDHEVITYLSGFEKLTVVVSDVTEAIRTDNDFRILPFGFAHVDVDIEIPTFAALQFFGQSLAKGGVIVVDDYEAVKCPGVKIAVDRFLSMNPDFIGCRPYVGFIKTEQIVLIKR